jgi:transposase
MYLQRINKKTKNKTYSSVVLMESYREGKKVKHRIISNLSNWSQPMIDGLEKILKDKNITSISDLQLSTGKSFGAIYAVSEIAKRLGINQALGNSFQSNLALLQIAGRIITQGSRNYLANEWLKGQSVDKIFKINKLTEDDLYANLDWLSENQSNIEQKIYNFRKNKSKLKEIFLYDVTSSYLEGEKNELAMYGYNRDKKKEKKQIVIGLMTDSEGYPVTVEVFKGNTSDTKTVSNQLKKLKNNFGVERVVFVGDKGMLKSAQIEELTSDEYHWNYLTTITKEQIETLLKQDVIQLELFENEIMEVEDKATHIRYILRKNPVRDLEIKQNRTSRINGIKTFVTEQNIYLTEHKYAQPKVALRKTKEKIIKLKLQKFVNCTLIENKINLTIDTEAQKEAEKLDGCYVIKTDVPKNVIDAKIIHDRYKDLANVEFAFRTMKTTLEEIRPVYVRKKGRTEGHVFVVMLAYLIVKYLTDKCSSLNYTRKFIIESLDKINYLQYTNEGKTINIAPQHLLAHQKEIIDCLNLKLK